jgi:hypothetical protein
MKTLTLVLDDDDERAVQAAMAERQRSSRWDDSDGGVLLPEGDSDLPGAIIAEICRAYVDYRRLEA